MRQLLVMLLTIIVQPFTCGSWEIERKLAEDGARRSSFTTASPIAGAVAASSPYSPIQAHHVVLPNGSAYRHGGNQNFLGPNGLSKLTERLMH
jgi:hypothetical protein